MVAYYIKARSMGNFFSCIERIKHFYLEGSFTCKHCKAGHRGKTVNVSGLEFPAPSEDVISETDANEA